MSSFVDDGFFFAVDDVPHNPCPVASWAAGDGFLFLTHKKRETSMTRTTITLPTRLQLLNFFLVVDNVVKSVIARLKEERTSAVGEGPTKGDLDEVRGVILKLFDEVISLRDDVEKQKQDSLLVTLAALNSGAKAATPFAWPVAPDAPSTPSNDTGE